MLNAKQNNFGELPDERLEQELEDIRAKLNSRLSRRKKRQCEGKIRAITKVIDTRKEVENVVPIRPPEQVQVSTDSNEEQAIIDIGEKLDLDKKVQIERTGDEEYVVTQDYYGEIMTLNSSSLKEAIYDAGFLGADTDGIEKIINELREVG